MSRNYRIKDIAQLSGVSTGTVDRILHNRGKVSEEARKKVEKVLNEIDYHPNLIARSLALRKKYHIYTLIPSFQKGEYWETFSKGIIRAEEELFSYNVDVIPLYFNQYDRSSFDKLIDRIDKEDCQGVVVATLFKESVQKLSLRLDEKAIPYVLVDAFIEGTNAVTYYGTHSYDSGFLAGRLLLEQIDREEDIAIFRFFRKGDISSTQVQIRETGFRDYLSKNAFSGKIHLVSIHADNAVENEKILDAFFEQNPEIRAGIIFNSRAHLLGQYLSKREPQGAMRLIGYDVIEENITYLNKGIISHLIAQRPEVQGLNSVKSLFRHLVLHEQIDKVNYMPIDILMKENIQFYNNYI